ncbi:MAG TPA: hypothetical protein DCY20_07625 [Firmicutes bacterium]|nr:hypothetical protein [Bacillota bacterium]
MKEPNALVEQYILDCPENIQERLIALRTIVKKVAPEVEETFAYKMPAYKYKGVLVYFSAFKNHIGFYPTNSGIEAFQDELTGYKFSKGAIQFPHNKPIPYELIEKIVKFRVAENLEKELLKK